MSATTVPIRPIAKGTLSKLWVGLALLALVAAALAYVGVSDINEQFQSSDAFLAENGKTEGVETTESGLQFQTIKAGEGPSPSPTDIALVGYKGMLIDGTVFDEAPQAPFPVGQVVPGFSEALQKMQKGGEYKIWIPSDLGYGPDDQTNPQTGEVAIPGGSVLVFEVNLQDFRTQAEVEEFRRQAEQLQGAQSGVQGGAQGGPQGGVPQGLPPEIQAQLEAQLRGGQ